MQARRSPFFAAYYLVLLFALYFPLGILFCSLIVALFSHFH